MGIISRKEFFQYILAAILGTTFISREMEKERNRKLLEEYSKILAEYIAKKLDLEARRFFDEYYSTSHIQRRIA